jgi:hypothetical protein
MNRALSSRAADLGPAETADVPMLTEQPVLTVEQLPRGAGWLLITAGVVGVVVPGPRGAVPACRRCSPHPWRLEASIAMGRSKPARIRSFRDAPNQPLPRRL